MIVEHHHTVRAPGSWRRFTGAVAALAVVAVGIPAVLVVLASLTLSSWHPLPGIGSWDDIRGWATRELSDSEIAPVLLRVLLSVAWLLWLGLAWSVAVTAVTARPALHHLRLPRLHMFDGLGNWIAAGLTAVASLTPRPAESAPLPTVPATAVVSSATAHQMDLVVPVRPTGRPGWARVQHGESIAEFAARTLGDSNRWSEVWDLNRGRTMDELGTTWTEVWRIDDGWELELPPTTVPGGAATPALRLVDTPASDVGRYVVAAGDSYWRIAERTLSAELGREPSGAEVLARTNTLIAINAGRLGEPGIPHMLHPGDVVDLAPGQTTDVDEPAVDGYVVAAGDSYWRIAERTLPAELGRQPSDAEILARTQLLVEMNADRLGEPDHPFMLQPDDHVRLPAAPAPPADTPPPPAATPAPPTVEATSLPTAEPPPDALTPLPSSPLPVADPTLSPAPSPDDQRPAPAPAPTAQTAATVTPRPDAAHDTGAAASDDGTAAATALVGMSAIALAGVAGTVAVRRRRAAQKARPHQRPAPVTPAEHDVMVRDLSDVTWMAAELRLLAHRLAPAARSALAVQLVQVTGHALEVAFAEIPATTPPAGWCPVADRVWRLDEPHGPEDLDPVLDAPPVLPALATIGDRTTQQLLLNLEAPAGINVTGEPGIVTAWLSSVVWEIAGAALSERPDIILVDVDIAGTDVLERVASMTADEAADAIDHDRADDEGSMLHRRVDYWEAWPPTIVIIAGTSLDAYWPKRAAAPDVAVLAVGGGLPDGLDVNIADGSLRIPAWRLEVAATLLEPATITEAVQVVQAADAEPVPDDFAVLSPSATTPLDAKAGDDWEPPAFAVTVHLLGEPHATRGDERLTMSPQVLSALAYLAVHRDVSVDDFKEAMWGGADVPRQRVADLLTAVRKPAGGRHVVGHIEDGRIRVGDTLGTDLDIFNALNTRAQEAPLELATRMHQIVDLVHGRPFAFPSTAAGMWGWVDHETLEALWGMRISTVAWELAGLHLDRDDPVVARDIAECGLKADPLNAALTERLMEAYSALNAVEAAQRVYEAHDRALTARGFDGAAQETRRVLERLRAAHLTSIDDTAGAVAT